MRGGPRALLLIISKKIDDERPHRSPFVVNSYHFLPGRPLLARSLVDRAKPARYAAGKSCELFSYDICYDISYDIYYDMSMSAPCN